MVQITHYLPAADFARIIATLSRHDLGAIADRLVYLQSALEEEPGEPPIEIRSLSHFARFIMTYPQLPHPRIAVSPDGLIQIEWRGEDNGIAAMKFLLDDNIQFVAIQGASQDASATERVSGILRKTDALRALQPFITRIESQ